MGFGVTEKTGHDGGRDFRLAGRSRQKIINRALLWLAERVAGTIFRAPINGLPCAYYQREYHAFRA